MFRTNSLILIAYFISIFILVYYAMRRTKNTYDYTIGSRQFNSFITAMGAAASDMSGWLLMGLPGAVFISGVSTLWLPLGLLIGAYLNWLFIAPKLRVFSEQYNNALTLPNFLSERFLDQKHHLSRLGSFLIIIFFAFYAASGLVAGAMVFQNIYHLNYTSSLLITTTLMLLFTSLGGYLAINWLDAAQATFIFFALLIVPTMTYHHLHNSQTVLTLLHIHRQPQFFNTWGHINKIIIFSWLSWGLGYFGQPHILARFMSSQSVKTIAQGRRICMTWILTCLTCAVLVGFLGAAFVQADSLNQPEDIFLYLSQSLFPPILTGLLYAAVLSAILNVISAQLLSSATSLTQDILSLNQSQYSQNTKIWLNRAAVIIIGLIALYIAKSPSQTILSLIGFAWACLGSTFGPTLIFSLYWSRINFQGALAGLLVGALVSVFWPAITQQYRLVHIYAMIPAFLLSSLAIVVVSFVTQKQKQVTQLFLNLKEKNIYR